MSPKIKLNIIEYLFSLYINKLLQKKSIWKRNLTFFFAGQIDPPLGSLRYGKPLGSLRVKQHTSQDWQRTSEIPILNDNAGI